MKSYSKRTWLNVPEKESTGSVVCFSGMSSWIKSGDTSPHWTRFVEIADCKGKVTLHQSFTDTDAEYINKIELLSNEINDYLKHLKSELKEREK